MPHQSDVHVLTGPELEDLEALLILQRSIEAMHLRVVAFEECGSLASARGLAKSRDEDISDRQQMLHRTTDAVRKAFYRLHPEAEPKEELAT